MLKSVTGLPLRAEGNLIGYLNNVDIVNSTINATITPGDTTAAISGSVRNVPPAAGECVCVCVRMCMCVCCLYVSVRMNTLVREVQLL